MDAQKIQWGSFAELNAWLGERCRAWWGELRHPEFKEFSVLEMLEQERLHIALLGMVLRVCGCQDDYGVA